ncbi:hypothetical protein CKM354_001215800 [Cercospora kikuchii]|uniref:Uncharacterized protein n=1 Tax=Cercospora kikuchii TaxID=84275 RepID=A0A9P3L153_9PEZI|nr:uncharacterized protein CKM354_001215800 [Cercospora kikuchii]GIZ49119.1 hypothetical protein CKM354_001215800 [Cercospora kikuchii]
MDPNVEPRPSAAASPMTQARNEQMSITNVASQDNLTTQLSALEAHRDSPSCLGQAAVILRKLPRGPEFHNFLSKETFDKLESHILAVHKRTEGRPGKHRSLSLGPWKLPLAVGWALFGGVFLTSFNFCDNLLNAQAAGLELASLYDRMVSIRDERVARGAKNARSHKRTVIEWKPRDVQVALSQLVAEKDTTGSTASSRSQSPLRMEFPLPLSEPLREVKDEPDYEDGKGEDATSRSSLDPEDDLSYVIGRVGYPDVASALRSSSMTPLEQCSSEVHQLWTDLGGLPRLLPSSMLFPGTSTITERELYVECMRLDEFQLLRDSEQVVADSAEGKRRLLEELAYDYRHEEPIAEHYSAVFKLQDGYTLCIPPMQDDLIAKVDHHTSVSLKSHGDLTDVRFDRKSCVLFWPVGNTRSIFFLWPPTQENLERVQERSGKNEGLPFCCEELEGGLVAVLHTTEALRIRPGTIHAILTVSGGFTMSRSYIDARGV